MQTEQANLVVADGLQLPVLSAISCVDDISIPTNNPAVVLSGKIHFAQRGIKSNVGQRHQQPGRAAISCSTGNRGSNTYCPAVICVNEVQRKPARVWDIRGRPAVAAIGGAV